MVKKSKGKYIKTKRLYHESVTGGDQDNVAEITVDRDSELVAMTVDISAAYTVDGSRWLVEFSTNPNNQCEALGSVGQIAVFTSVLEGSSMDAVNVQLVFDVPMIFYAGEKIYCNVTAIATLPVYIGAVFHLAEFDAPIRR